MNKKIRTDAVDHLYAFRIKMNVIVFSMIFVQ